MLGRGGGGGVSVMWGLDEGLGLCCGGSVQWGLAKDQDYAWGSV